MLGVSLKVNEQPATGSSSALTLRPLLTHDPSMTRSISRLLNRLMKRGKGGRSGAKTVRKGKWISGGKLGSCGWNIVAGRMGVCRVYLRVGEVGGTVYTEDLSNVLLVSMLGLVACGRLMTLGVGMVACNLMAPQLNAGLEYCKTIHMQ